VSQAQTGTAPLVQAKDLTVAYGGQKVLDVPSIEVFRHEVLGIIGPNGSGKTTLLLCLTRLIKPATGIVFYHGMPVADGRSVLQLHRQIAVVFQESLLLNNSVWDNIVVGLKLRRVKPAEIKARAEKWLERFGIAALAKRQTRTLSSGEAKRTSLARAFALQPEVMFLDEPFTALDGPTRQALLEDFKSVLGETKMTTVIVTHDRNEALALTDRLGVIIQGNIVQIGTPAEVFSSPANEEIANFIEAGNIIHGVVATQNEGLAIVRAGNVQIEVCSELPAGSRVILLLPYDDVTLNLPSAAAVTTSARNRFPGKVVKLFRAGSQVKVTLDCGFQLTALITRKSAEEMALREGTGVVAMIKAVSVRVIARH
jgi:tungstate transport system ATP-binding protein